MTTCCEMDPVVGEREWEGPRCEAGRSLRRLVGFVASALDVRFAFVVALDPPAGSQPVAVWLARDYGLRSEYARLGNSPKSTPALDFGPLFHDVWPHESELAGISPDRCVSLSLRGTRGQLAGHLGILDAERTCRLSARERLAPLARRAALEVERWIGATG